MKNKDCETTSGNIFADLGLQNPEEHLAKARLAMQIDLLIEKKGLNQKDAAKLLGIDQPKISALHKGKLSGFSLERLFRFLNILGQEIDIQVKHKGRRKGARNINVSLPKIRKRIESEPDEKTAPAMLARKK